MNSCSDDDDEEVDVVGAPDRARPLLNLIQLLLPLPSSLPLRNDNVEVEVDVVDDNTGVVDSATMVDVAMLAVDGGDERIDVDITDDDDEDNNNDDEEDDDDEEENVDDDKVDDEAVELVGKRRVETDRISSNN